MNSKYDSQTLLSLFGPLEKYGCVTPFSDVVGFSVQREYPNHVCYYPSKTRSGIANNVVLMKVVCDYNTPASTDNWIPLRFDVVNFDRYLAGHQSYNQQDLDSPTHEEIEKSKKSSKPINFYGLFPNYYIKDKTILVDKYSKIVNGHSILDKLYERHCNLLRSSFIVKQKLFTMRQSFHKRCMFVVKYFFDLISVKQLLIDNKIYSTHYALSDVDVKNKIGIKGLDFTPCGIFILSVACVTLFILKGQNKNVKLLFDNNVINFSALILFFLVMRYILPLIFVCLLNAIDKDINMLENSYNWGLRAYMENSGDTPN